LRGLSLSLAKSDNSMSNYSEYKEIIKTLIEEAHHFIEQGYYEDAVSKLQKCLRMEIEFEDRLSVLDELGYCFMRLGWYEDAVKTYNQILEVNPTDNDTRFFRASAYASLKWIDEAIKELKIILASDTTDILARHDLALWYRSKGWMRESLEEMRTAKKYAETYGSSEEKEVVESSLEHLEEEIENGGDDETKNALLRLILALMIKRRLKIKKREGRKDKG
jgi:tetratricopeptide (TPR) repeat protein